MTDSEFVDVLGDNRRELETIAELRQQLSVARAERDGWRVTAWLASGEEPQVDEDVAQERREAFDRLLQDQNRQLARSIKITRISKWFLLLAGIVDFRVAYESAANRYAPEATLSLAMAAMSLIFFGVMWERYRKKRWDCPGRLAADDVEGQSDGGQDEHNE